jgi:hypothetical protein
VRGVIVNPGHAFDHDSHPRQGPESRGKPVGLRSLAEGGVHSRQLPPIDLRLPSRSAGPTQGGSPAVTPGPIPPQDALATDAQSPRNGPLRFLPHGEEGGRALPTYFHSLEVPPCCAMGAHAFMVRSRTSLPVTILCKAQ